MLDRSIARDDHKAMDDNTFIQTGHILVIPGEDFREVLEQVEEGLLLLLG